MGSMAGGRALMLVGLAMMVFGGNKAEGSRGARDGALRNGKGEPFTLEYLDSGGGGERIVAPFFQALEKLGIGTVEFRHGSYRYCIPNL